MLMLSDASLSSAQQLFFLDIVQDLKAFRHSAAGDSLVDTKHRSHSKFCSNLLSPAHQQSLCLQRSCSHAWCATALASHVPMWAGPICMLQTTVVAHAPCRICKAAISTAPDEGGGTVIRSSPQICAVMAGLISGCASCRSCSVRMPPALAISSTSPCTAYAWMH